MPCLEGRNEQGYYNNWWKYLTTLDFVESISPVQNEISMDVGENGKKIKFVCTYKSGKKETISSDKNIKILDKSIIDIAKDGTIIGKKCGKTTIEFWKDGRKSTINVEVGKSITDFSIEPIPNHEYSNTIIKPNVILKNASKKLNLNSDYTVEYSNNKNVGTATVTINGIGNYKDTKKVNFNIIAKNLSKLKISSIKTQAYTGVKITPSVIIKDGNYQLKLNEDYTVKYSNNKNAGTATATITGTKNYKGTYNLKFKIVNLKINVDSNNTYTGKEIKPKVTVKDGDYQLKLDKDYTIGYINNKDAGTALVSVVCKGNYEGSMTQSFNIAKADISKLSINTISSQTYTGKEITPNPAVKDGSKKLIKDTDYTLSYSKNKNAGTGTVTITGKGNYTGAVNKTFKIAAKNVANLTIANITNKIYTGKEIKPNPEVKDESKKLTKDTDYTLSYSKNTNIGTGTVTITGKGNYTGSVNKTFKIVAKNFADLTIANIANQSYTGKEIKPNPEIKDGSKKLTKDIDYTLSYSKNKNVGTATITITGKGVYTGSVGKTFNIFECISINKTTATVKKGKSITLTATITANNTADKTVKWSSSDTAVATVNNNGKVTGVKKGTAIITAKSVNGKTVKCTVTVTK